MNQKILIVDDEADMRELVRAILEIDGYQVSEAANLASLRERLPKGAPDLVVLDLSLTDGNGLSALPDLRRRWPQTKVIIVTGYGAGVETEAACQDDDVFFQPKPFEPDSLRTMVHSALALRAAVG